jgi:sulfide dehydrogenase [flavocytochrome c] flavoprotein subunit
MPNNRLSLTRRRLGRLAAGSPLLALAGPAIAQATASVVVIGGGFGGAAAARALRRFAPAAKVTLIEPARQFHTCPFSNYVLAGFRTMADITHGYDGLRGAGIDVVHDTAVVIEAAARTIRLASGGAISFDRAIVSPGIDFRWDQPNGYGEQAALQMPHAWKAGEQTVLLRRQLEAMPDGGLVILAPPSNPFRCPPGPYERAAMIAHYLKAAKPRSKILILDAKDAFSKQRLFQDGWKQLYGEMIEWVPAAKGGKIARVEPQNLTVVTANGERHRGAVVNLIPPQMAGHVARNSDLATDAGWCPVDPATFEATRHRNVHVIGDACIAGAMPKSGFSANSQAKVAALAVADALAGRPTATPTYVNTCYSLLAPDYGISVADVYRAGSNGIAAAPNAGGLSPADAGADIRRAEARYAEGWYAAIAHESWGS